MPKKQNGFFNFMLEWKTKEEKKGHKFPRGIIDVQNNPDCQEAWKNLSQEKKNFYKLLAKNNMTNPAEKKRTTVGELLSVVERNNMKEGIFHKNMVEYITTLINTAKNQNNIHRLKFYVIHINFFYSRVLINNEVEYYPAEISIVEFSIEKGIQRVYHEFVNEKIKLGYSNAAKEHSLKYHQIPLNPSFGKSDYQEIFRDICKFITPEKKNGKYPPLYTFHSKETDYLPVKFVLNKLGIFDGKPEDFLLLYSLEHLFSSIYNAAIDDTKTVKLDPIIATIELKKDPFNYTSGLECYYHGNLNVGLIYCSQSIVKRWIFVIFSFCCNPLKISMKPGIHKPDNDFTEDKDLISSRFRSLDLSTSKRR